MTKLFHITDAQVWEAAQAQGYYAPQSLIEEGFIHLSMNEQVLVTATRFYRGQTGLVLLEIEGDRLIAEVRNESVLDHGVFPHLYGSLNLDAVVQVWPFEPNESGAFEGWG